MRAGGAQWGARAALAVVSATLIAGSARAEPIEVVAPPDIGGVVTAWPLGDGSTDTRQSSAVEPGGVAVIRVPKETPQRYVIRFNAEDGRVWRVVLSGADRQEWPERHEIAAESLYQPASVDLLFNVPGWGRMPLISVLIRESDDYSRSSILRPSGGRTELHLTDLRPGTLQIHAQTDTGLQASDLCQCRDGGDLTRNLTLSRQTQYYPDATPLFGSGGDVSSDLYTAVSVAVYGLVVLIWLVLGVTFTAIWRFFGLKEAWSQGALSVATAIIGAVLLGNGIAMFLLGQVRYVPLVCATAAAQLVLLIICLLAYVSRKAWCRELAVIGLVFTMLASLAFLPTFCFEDDLADIGAWLTRVQVVLVCVAAIGLIAAALIDRRRALAATGVCRRCGERPHPITGRCECLPRPVGRRGPRLARLSVVHADHTYSAVVIGPSTVLGTSRRCHIRLRGDPKASERHAVIESEEGRLVVRDLGSKAGTYVNGLRVTRQVLEDTDEIVIGESSMLVEII